MKENADKYPCPCCGFLTLSEGTHETFEVCPVCNWEDDDVQFYNPNFRGGANLESLNEARQNYKKFGASSAAHINDVKPPLDNELPH